jgi:hypothetical protein
MFAFVSVGRRNILRFDIHLTNAQFSRVLPLHATRHEQAGEYLGGIQ